MRTALYKGREIHANDFGYQNPAPETDLVCPICKKSVSWRLHINEPPSGPHFAHAVASGSCVNTEGVRNRRSSTGSTRAGRANKLVFAPRSRRRRSALALVSINVQTPVRIRSSSGTSSTGGPIQIRDAADALLQQILAEGDASGAVRELSIDFKGRTYPWSAFYFRLGTYLEIHRLDQIGALPPYIAVEVRRDLHPKRRYGKDDVPCRPAEDRERGMRVTPVVVNGLNLETPYFDRTCVVIAQKSITVTPGHHGWSFAQVTLSLSRRDFIARR